MPLREIILVVDDDFEIRQVMAEILEEHGYRAICAANGREALQLLDGQKLPALVLLDITMPEMNGADFRYFQTEVPHWASIPVVIFTGDPDAESVAKALGAAGHLKKPMHLAELLRVVRQFASEQST
jgi:CheY-like chemotaxis protein